MGKRYRTEGHRINLVFANGPLMSAQVDRGPVDDTATSLRALNDDVLYNLHFRLNSKLSFVRANSDDLMQKLEEIISSIEDELAGR